MRLGGTQISICNMFALDVRMISMFVGDFQLSRRSGLTS
jgi:hypothetical protein